MKKLFIMLLIACSAFTTANAQQRLKPTNALNPNNVIKSFEFIIDLYGQKAGQTYSVEKNPNTGIIESKERIVPFVCKKSEPYITMMGDEFMKDEPKSYQIKHITPGQGSQNFTLAAHTNIPNVINHYAIRTKSDQEMWFMACKNPENPSLRDAYAIVWQPAPDNKVKGTIYMISSPRPSNFGKAFESSNSKKKIDNVVGNVVDEDEVVVDTCIVDTVEVDESEVAVDTLVIDDVIMMPNDNPYGAQTIPVSPQPNYNMPQSNKSEKWKPSQQQIAQLMPKVMAMQANMEAIKATYASLEPLFKSKNFAGTDKIFEQITKQNKAMEKGFQELFKELQGFAIPYDKRAEFFSEGYKEILKFFTEQNQLYTEILKEFGTLPKGAQKAQKELNKIIEKNMKEMGKAISGIK
jgi:hypothetical protein